MFRTFLAPAGATANSPALQRRERSGGTRKSRRSLCHSSIVSEKVECRACSQPRSGVRMQPTAHAVGGQWELSKPRRGEREAMTQTPEGRLKFSRTLFSAGETGESDSSPGEPALSEADGDDRVPTHTLEHFPICCRGSRERVGHGFTGCGKLGLRIRVSLQRYHKFFRTRRPFRGGQSIFDFFRSLFSRAAKDRQKCGP